MDGLAYSFSTLTVAFGCLVFGQLSGLAIREWLTTVKSRRRASSDTYASSEKPDRETKSKNYRTAVISDCFCIALACAFYAGALVAYFVGPKKWRPEVTFALLLGPPGAILRFILSKLNSRGKFLDRFPMGTFIANILATGVVAASYVVQRTSYRTDLTITGCNAMIGIEQGFCGCLSTVSTFAVETRTIDRKRWKMIYVLSSVVLGHLLVLAIVGGVKWSREGLGPFCH
jgi:CrcB protein